MNERRTARLEIKLTPTERAAWEKLALQQGYTSTSEFVRVTMTSVLLLSHIHKGPK